MANELNIALGDAYLGLSMDAEIYTGAWAIVGTAITMTESFAGLYTASVPGTPAFGTYNIVFRENGGEILGSGLLMWDGAAEVNPDDMFQFLQGGREIDFTTDVSGWERVERDIAGTEIRRYNLYDEDGNRAAGTVAAFIANNHMIAKEIAQ